MTKKAGWGLIAGGLVLVTGALLPVSSGGTLDWMLLVLAVVFLIVGIKKTRFNQPRPDA